MMRLSTCSIQLREGNSADSDVHRCRFTNILILYLWCFSHLVGFSCHFCLGLFRLILVFVPAHEVCVYVTDAVSVIFVNENENENGEKRENNKFVNEN